MPSVPVCELRYIFDFDFNSLFVRLSLIFLQAVINQCKVSRRSSTRAIWLIDSIVRHSPNQPPTPLWAPNPQKSFLYDSFFLAFALTNLNLYFLLLP